ncbi:hypothetical protein HPB52_014147 [Rhipicephalus sanguineus]|uniref:Uncharacterized protein n=1 Tax=Rhipicephalus sanguineus TaxID=34632 RepID=A0A9D4PDX8_RHISA|nr:hypothetical protein HPB52_014147 [Rhipicephalus sanguineus]
MNRRPFAPPPVSRGKGEEDLYERYGVALAWTHAEKADNLVFALEDLLRCLLHEAIKRACEGLQASHDGAVCQQRQEEAERKELHFQYGDQEKVLAQHWTNLTNFPVLSADLAVAAAPSSLSKEMWADVVHRSASATMTAVTPKVTEADAAHGYPPLPITAGASTRALTGTVDAQVKLHPVHAPALVGGVWIHRKVTKTGRAAVPLPLLLLSWAQLLTVGRLTPVA